MTIKAVVTQADEQREKPEREYRVVLDRNGYYVLQYRRLRWWSLWVHTGSGCYTSLREAEDGAEVFEQSIRANKREGLVVKNLGSITLSNDEYGVGQ